MKTHVRTALFAAGALSVALAAPPPAVAASDAEVDALKRQVEILSKRLQEVEKKQEDTDKAVEDTRKRAVLSSGRSPGSFVIPGTDTEFEIGGYVKTDLIYDFDESTGDLFVPESITTSGSDKSRFRAHARQSRIFFKTSTPTEMGKLKTHIEGDFFGGGGNEVFSNSYRFRLRHAYASLGGWLAGQTWSNFMPIESYPSTVDFNGPAGIPFVRQAQIRYTAPIGDGMTLSASLENSEFNGRNAAGAFSESTTLGIRAGVDRAPDATLAFRWQGDGAFLKLAGVGRLLHSPTSGDEEFGWGVNLSGNADLWEGGKVLGSFTYGDGVGRYIINGFGQDAFVDAAGNVNTIEAYGVTVGVSQKVTDEVTAALAYGRYEAMDSFAATDLDSVNTVHASLFWKPVDRMTVGGEVIWGDRNDASGADDSALRVQGSVQVNF